MVAAFRSPSGASSSVLRYAAQGRVTVIATQALFLEYESVLTRPEHLAAAGVTIAEANDFLVDLADMILPVGVRFTWRPQLHDPDDEMVLEAAINGGVRALVTFETRTFIAAARRFGVGVLTPGAMYLRLMP